MQLSPNYTDLQALHNKVSHSNIKRSLVSPDGSWRDDRESKERVHDCAEWAILLLDARLVPRKYSALELKRDDDKHYPMASVINRICKPNSQLKCLWKAQSLSKYGWETQRHEWTLRRQDETQASDAASQQTDISIKPTSSWWNFLGAVCYTGWVLHHNRQSLLQKTARWGHATSLSIPNIQWHAWVCLQEVVRSARAQNNHSTQLNRL